MPTSTTAPDVVLADEIADALARGLPVVALESTIISHGMPYPRNVQTALEVEQTVRDCGAMPATIAILDGCLLVGLSPDEIDRVGAIDGRVSKVSRRDLGIIIARRGNGATTVAATMIVAAMAGIKVFATGGIGGVHRGAGDSFDVSADLQELARTDVTVVCAGVKSILDVPATLEVLETLGVPVIGLATDVMPAFYTRESDVSVPFRCDTIAEVAEVMAARRRLGLGGGMVVANPIPAAASMPRTVIDAAIEQALRDADSAGVRGKEITPYLLARVAALTGNASLVANIALVHDNARVAAELAQRSRSSSGP